ncbi:MAG TPA: hypothetical protein VNN08_08540 [Thermoanaerobaculia bacterium]|nr:hypothetical protein [Thermoanaerobaculia bacterium]
MNTNDDPIVAEIRAIRREPATRFGDDINALCDFLVERDREHQDRLVNYPPRSPRVTDADDASGK